MSADIGGVPGSSQLGWRSTNQCASQRPLTLDGSGGPGSRGQKTSQSITESAFAETGTVPEVLRMMMMMMMMMSMEVAARIAAVVVSKFFIQTSPL